MNAATLSSRGMGIAATIGSAYRGPRPNDGRAVRGFGTGGSSKTAVPRAPKPAPNPASSRAGRTSSTGARGGAAEAVRRIRQFHLLHRRPKRPSAGQSASSHALPVPEPPAPLIVGLCRRRHPPKERLWPDSPGCPPFPRGTVGGSTAVSASDGALQVTADAIVALSRLSSRSLSADPRAPEVLVGTGARPGGPAGRPVQPGQRFTDSHHQKHGHGSHALHAPGKSAPGGQRLGPPFSISDRNGAPKDLPGPPRARPGPDEDLPPVSPYSLRSTHVCIPSRSRTEITQTNCRSAGCSPGCSASTRCRPRGTPAARRGSGSLLAHRERGGV